MKNGLLAALVFLVAACGAYHLPGGPSAGSGTVTGQVTVIPCGPVEPAQPDLAPCKMRPSEPVLVLVMVPRCEVKINTIPTDGLILHGAKSGWAGSIGPHGITVT